MKEPVRQRKVILVVDDEEMIRSIIECVFQKEYDVLSASSGEEAIKLLKNTPHVDLVITDLEMPRGDGEMLIRHIRGEGRIIPCVLMSGGNDPRCERWFEYSFDDFIRKPLSISVLRKTVEDLLNFRSCLRWFEPKEE